MSTTCDLLASFAKVLAAMSPWLVVGFFAAGVIAVWIPRAWVNRVMGGSSGFSGILRAVLVGVPLPICSCGVLPIATGLRRNGAGKGATAAFLISTPQTGIDSILATYALMGPVFAIARPLAAAYVATISTGAILCGCAVNFFTDATAATETARCASHGLTAVHWTCAAFLAVMMVYNLIRPVKMVHAKPVAKPCCSSCKE